MPGDSIRPTITTATRSSWGGSNGNYAIFFTRPIALGLLITCGILLSLSAFSFFFKREDWRDELAEAEAGEIQE